MRVTEKSRGWVSDTAVSRSSKNCFFPSVFSVFTIPSRQCLSEISLQMQAALLCSPRLCRTKEGQTEPHWSGSGSQASLPEPAAASADTVRAPPLWRAEGEWWGEGWGAGKQSRPLQLPWGSGGASSPFPSRAFVGSVQGAPGSILGTESSVGGPLRATPRERSLKAAESLLSGPPLRAPAQGERVCRT